MAHQIETMAWTNEKPWHGLGVRVDRFNSIEHMLEAASLNWKIELSPIAPVRVKKFSGDIELAGKAIEDRFALVRDSDDAVLDVVGSRYRPVQNAQAFEFFRDFVEAGKATLETAGSLRGGRYVWGLANMGSKFSVGAAAKNDVVKNYLLVGAPHESGKSLLAKYTNVRVVCNNTLTLALSGGANVFTWTHNTAFSENAIALGKRTLADATKVAEEFEANAGVLAKLNLSDDEVKKILTPVFMPETVKAGAKVRLNDVVAEFENLATRPLRNVLEAYKKAPGADPGTGWGALNAVTYWADHMASHNADNRLANSWMGRTANQKATVLDSLLALAA